jgi:hypothetical protein
MEPTMKLNKLSIHVHEVENGIWIVHDELDRKGGCFRDRAAALRFVDDEFGKDAVTVIHPHFATPEERLQSRSSTAFQAAAAR